MVCLSVILLCDRITCVWFCDKRFCNKKGAFFVPDPVENSHHHFPSSFWGTNLQLWSLVLPVTLRRVMACWHWGADLGFRQKGVLSSRASRVGGNCSGIRLERRKRNNWVGTSIKRSDTKWTYVSKVGAYLKWVIIWEFHHCMWSGFWNLYLQERRGLCTPEWTQCVASALGSPVRVREFR